MVRRSIPGGGLLLIQSGLLLRNGHESRNMLSAVLWYAEALEMDPHLAPGHRQALGEIRAAARRAADLLSAPPEPSSDDLPEAPGGKVGAVLLVDDEPILLAVMAEFLTGEGHRVVLANTGREALEFAREEPDLRAVILDLTLPDMDGLDLARRMVGMVPGLQVVFLSGDPDAGGRVRPEDGMLLLKPAPLAAVAACLHQERFQPR